MGRVEEHHARGIVGDHIAECLGCGEVTEVGWAHHCRPCWDKAIVEDPATYEGQAS